MESSQFSDECHLFETKERVETSGATCDTYRVKLYGKLHFLKQLKPQYINDIRYQESLHKEFETGFRLEHSNLVRYVSISADGILMEYVDGETLTQVLASNPDYFHSYSNVKKFLRQFLDVVGYLHSHQVLHLDLKPDNILLTRINHDVKLIDLGFSHTDTFADTKGYTNHFAAPEQRNGGTVDERTDIYAIGKIIELLPNHHIYNKVVARCLANDPKHRYQSIEQLSKSINHHNRFLFPTVVLLFLSIIVCVAFFIPTKEVAVPVGVSKPTDTIVNEANIVKEVIAPPSVLPVTEEQQPLIQSPIREDNREQMKVELDKQIDKAYKTTIATFCDSVFPSPTAGEHWKKQSSEFHAQVLQSAADIARKYPNIPESIIMEHVESRFQSLTAFVFNNMRENGRKTLNK